MIHFITIKTNATDKIVKTIALKAFWQIILASMLRISYEQAYYKYIYNKHYQGCDNLIHYYWMPRFIDSNDASARTLNIYNEENNNIQIQE